MRSIRTLVAILFVGLILIGCASRPDRLLFVVPTQMPDGQPSTQQLLALEDWLSVRSGGFTRINNVEGGWMAPDGTLVREANVLYLLSLPHGTPQSFESELEEQILYGFEQQEAWIQRW